MTPRAARRHRLPALALLVSFACVLSACTASSEDSDDAAGGDAGAAAQAPSPEPQTSEDARTPAEEAGATDADDQFVSWVRMNGVSEDTLGDELILTTGHGTCASLDAGESLASVVDGLASVDVSDEGRETLVALPYAAVSVFCPGHADKIQ